MEERYADYRTFLSRIMPTPISSPRFSDSAIVGDDPFLSAMLCSRLARRGEYLTVLEAPRMARPDVQAEVITCNNALARVGAVRHFFAGIGSDSKNALRPYFNDSEIVDISEEEMLSGIRRQDISGELIWGRRNIAVGLLKAMHEKKYIVFSDAASTQTYERGLNSHLVVVEDGDLLAQVMVSH